MQDFKHITGYMLLFVNNQLVRK